jgi:NADPH:quinone reductase-like Zn-dependent oxidoreductase
VVKSERRNLIAAAWEIFHLEKFNPMTLMAANKAVIGVNINHLTRRMDIVKREMEGLLQLMEQASIRPRVDKSFPLDKIADAHRCIHERKNRGQAVLTR